MAGGSSIYSTALSCVVVRCPFAVRMVAALCALIAFASCRISPAAESLPAMTSIATELSPLIIAHRGASGHRPEHTLEAYALAIEMGADYIEPDLVATRDGVLVARHENEIGGTTNVSVLFPDRKTVKRIDGVDVEGWFTEDLTLAELRTLRARERLAFRSHAFDDQLVVPTFEEIVTLADHAGRARGRVVGVYPELKHPTYFASIGLPLVPRLLAVLRSHGLDHAESPMLVQCFEVATLKALHAESTVRLVQLLSGTDVPYDRQVVGDVRTGTDLVTRSGLAEIAAYAYAIGVHSRMVVGASVGDAPTSLVRDAHAAGLSVHVWTVRPEPVFLAARYAGDAEAEIAELVQLGVDGLFADYPDMVVRVLRR